MTDNLKTVSPDSSLIASKVLQPADFSKIARALEQVGLYGEVHLVVEKGRLRYIRTVHSEAVLAAPDRHLKSSG